MHEKKKSVLLSSVRSVLAACQEALLNMCMQYQLSRSTSKHQTFP